MSHFKICLRFEHVHVLDDSSMLITITDYNYFLSFIVSSPIHIVLRTDNRLLSKSA